LSDQTPHRIEMSTPDVNHSPDTDPPTPEPERDPVTERDTPRDAVFLTEAQLIKRRIDAIGGQMIASNMLLGVIAACAIYYVLKSGKVQVSDAVPS